MALETVSMRHKDGFYWYSGIVVVLHGGFDVSGKAAVFGSFHRAALEQTAVVFYGKGLPVGLGHVEELVVRLKIWFVAGGGKPIPWAGRKAHIAAVYGIPDMGVGDRGKFAAVLDGLIA